MKSYFLRLLQGLVAWGSLNFDANRRLMVRRLNSESTSRGSRVHSLPRLSLGTRTSFKLRGVALPPYSISMMISCRSPLLPFFESKASWAAALMFSFLKGSDKDKTITELSNYHKFNAFLVNRMCFNKLDNIKYELKNIEFNNIKYKINDI